MKSQTRILIVLLLVFTSVTAPAAVTEVNNVNGQTSTWEKVKITIKKWWNGEGEEPVQPKIAPRQPTPLLVAPTPTPTPIRKKPMPVTAEQNALVKLPLYAKPAGGSTLVELRAARDSVKATKLLSVAKPARVGTSKLGKTKAGVPAINWRELRVTKKIPRLDIGTEIQISRNDFKISSLNWGLSEPANLKRLSSPNSISNAELNALLNIKVSQALPQKAFRPTLELWGNR